MEKNRISFHQSFLRTVREVRETSDMKEAARLMAEGPWAIIAIAFDENDNSLYCLGRFELT